MSRQGQPRENTFETVKSFWEGEAADWGETPQVTIRDLCFRLHELSVLASLLPRGRRLLDVGCGTGFGTLFLSRRAETVVGIDYSENMIRWASRYRDDVKYRNDVLKAIRSPWNLDPGPVSHVDFQVADVTKLDLGGTVFDVITGQRILINLSTHDDQMNALRSIRRRATTDAWLLLIEATKQGHHRTDEYRSRFGLAPLEKYWHNQYVDTSRYDDWSAAGWRVTRVLRFDTYALLSKVVYPAAHGANRCQFLSGANYSAMEMANAFRTRTSVEELGTQRMLDDYAERVVRYDAEEGRSITTWLKENSDRLVDWDGLGHQELVIARAC